MMLPGATRHDRRAVLRGLLGGGAGSLALPLLGAAHAQSANTGALCGQGGLSYIGGKEGGVLPNAEWEPAPAGGSGEAGLRFRYAVGAEAVAKAPAGASRYDAATRNFPSGSLRILTFMHGAPVLHVIGFETEIFVLQGSMTLSPLYGLTGDSVTLNAGDALFLPSGILRNAEPREDTVLVTAIVGHTAHEPKSALIRARDATDEIARDPANAAKSSTRLYAFDGNSIRLTSAKKGGQGRFFAQARSDILIYIVKGHMRRTDGNRRIDLVPGDAVREKPGNRSLWEIVEDSTFLATDAPFDPASFSPTMAAR